MMVYYKHVVWRCAYTVKSIDANTDLQVAQAATVALPLSHPVQGGSVWVMVEFRVRLEAIRSRTDWTIQRWYGLC